jgi:Tfp pilus assembly protein PilO
MDKMKQWIALTVVGALAILAAGWFLVVSPKRSHASELRTQASEQERANAQLQTQLATLKAQAKALPAQQAKLAAVAAKIPNNSALPTLVRALNDAADNVGVELVSVAPGPVTAVATAPAAAVTTAASGTAAVPAASSAVGALQSIPMTLNVVGGYFQVAEFLDRLESLQRAFKVTGFNLAPGLNPVKLSASQPSVDTGKSLTASISGMVFESTGATNPVTAGK